RVAERARDDRVHEQGTGGGASADLVGEQREVRDAVPGGRAASEVLGDQQVGPTERDGLPPVVLGEPLGMAAQVPQRPWWHLVVEEPGRGAPEELLVGRGGEEHRSRPWRRSVPEDD